MDVQHPPLAVPEEEVHTHEYANSRADIARERYQPVSRVVEGRAISTWDAHKEETFYLEVALLTTVQDYLGYRYIACQVCHGHKACVRCMELTSFLQLGKDPGSSKTLYMRHRMWLPKNDP
jgi:hypothetical protein